MNKENNIDDISRDLLKAANITKAPESFTANIMSKIEVHKTVELPGLKPLISNGIWLLIAFITVGTTLISLLFNKNTESSFIIEKYPTIDFSFLKFINFSLPNIHFTDITLFAIASFGIFFLIQLIIIDRNSRANLS